jgi:hypothetical protein
VRLAGARHAVEQDSAPEVLSAGNKPGSMPGHAQDLALNPVEHLRRQDHLIARHLRAVDKAQQPAAVMIEDLIAEGDHVTPKDVVLHAEAADAVNQLVGAVGAGTGDLHSHFIAAMFFRRAQQHGRWPVGV